ncbi:unnamed protein product [Schistocephalus solidus]|uniref:C2H2-type domain-containing protein n=1 Tax=Schistocephalus solidus TaxID=70667 RepID=A0A183T0W3_SCHSO|nr:unnamed protein product [Schistocephalus solidus]
MIFAAHQLQEKCQEMLTHLYTIFFDLTKAFDKVNRDALWKAMQKFGRPERFTHMVRQLHDGMTARVTNDRTVSEAFAVTNVLKQGCVLAPTLFSLMLLVMLMDAYCDEQPGIRIASELTDTFSTFGVCRPQRACLWLQSMTCSSRTAAPLTPRPRRKGLRVESPRYSPEHQTEDVQGRCLDDTPLRSGDLDRLLEPSQEAESLPSQLPPWNTEAEMARQIPDTEVLERTGILSIHTMLRQVQLRWSGHLVRMDDERLSKRLFYEDVATGARRQGGQIDGLQVTSTADQHRRRPSPPNVSTLLTHIPHANRSGWTSSDAIYQQSNNSNFYVKFCQLDSPTLTPTIIETTSQYSSPVTPTTAATFTATTTISDGDSLLNCPQCDRTLTSRIGLIGHLQIYRTATGKPFPGAPTQSRGRHLHCTHCPRAFTHRMGLFGHMRIHDSGIHRTGDNTDTSCTPFAPAILPPLPPPLSRMTSPSLSYYLLPTLHPQLQLAHRPGWSHVNPSHGGWWTSAWGSSIQSTRLPPLPSLLPHIYTSHGSSRTHAPPRQPAKPKQCTLPTPIHRQHPHQHHVHENIRVN